MRVRLGDYVNIKTGKLDANAADENGIYPFFTCSIDPLKINTYAYDCECVLVAGNGDLNVKYYNGKFNAYQRTYIIESINKNVLAVPYLYCFLDKYVETLRLQSIGGVIKYIKLGNLTDAQITLPLIEEQYRILNEINKVNVLLEKRKHQLEKLDILVKSQFIEMFGNSQINEKGFPMQIVNDVIEFQGGSQPNKRFFEYEKTENNVRLIQIRDYKTDKYITYIPKNMVKRYCYADDIMIGRYGPPIFQILQGIEGAFNVALMKATPKKGNREFIRYFLKQDCLLHYLEGLSKRTAGQDGIQMDKLKQFPFPYPPIELQNEFARFVEQTDKSKFIIKQSLEKLETLKKALMQKYFG